MRPPGYKLLKLSIIATLISEVWAVDAGHYGWLRLLGAIYGVKLTGRKMHNDAGTLDGAIMSAAVASKDSKWPKTIGHSLCRSVFNAPTMIFGESLALQEILGCFVTRPFGPEIFEELIRRTLFLRTALQAISSQTCLFWTWKTRVWQPVSGQHAALVRCRPLRQNINGMGKRHWTSSWKRYSTRCLISSSRRSVSQSANYLQSAAFRGGRNLVEYALAPNRPRLFGSKCLSAHGGQACLRRSWMTFQAAPLAGDSAVVTHHLSER